MTYYKCRKTEIPKQCVILLAATAKAPSRIRVIGITEESVTIEWNEPERTGGTPITGYVIEKRDVQSTVWTQVTIVTCKTTSYKIQYLHSKMSYYFRVAAENDEGTGAFVEMEEPVNPMRPKSKYCPLVFVLSLEEPVNPMKPKISTAP